MSAIKVRSLTKIYGEQPAVDDLDLDVESGSLYGFLGPNGAGKTTTIRMVLGLVFPTSGTCELLGEPLRHGAPALERVGALIEEPGFWPYLSGRRNLECYARAGGSAADRRARLARIDEVLEIAGLEQAGKKRVKAYSQGMRQRLGIALAILGDPEVLVLDEPTNGLDPQGMRSVRTLLRTLADGGTTVFVSSHLLSEVDLMCDRVGVLAHGRLVAQGKPAELRSKSDRVTVEVNDVAGARRLLAKTGGLDVASTNLEATHGSGAGRLSVHTSDGLSAGAVNHALVSGGIEVSALIPERDSLEDVFVELVQGEDEAL